MNFDQNRKEIKDMTSNDGERHLENENNELKSKVDNLISEKRTLEMVIETNLRQDEDIFNNLKAENDNLRSKIKSLLKCNVVTCNLMRNHL